MRHGDGIRNRKIFLAKQFIENALGIDFACEITLWSVIGHLT